MPIYLYKCTECDIYEEPLLKVEERNKEIICDECGEPMKRIQSSFVNGYRPSHSRYAKYTDKVNAIQSSSI